MFRQQRQVYYKTSDEIALVRYSCELVGKTHAVVAEYIRPGITTAYLDKIAEDYIRSQGAVPSFKGYNNFPATLCISVNEQVVHGIPGNYVLQETDIVSIDCGVYANGFHGDSAYTYALAGVSSTILPLLVATKASLYKGIAQATAGKRSGDIGFAIQQYVEALGFSVVRELVGHGVGQQLHEAPDIPNYGRRGNGAKLLQGLVIAIEPMINMGVKEIAHANDGWTIVTADGKPSAHYEHTIAVQQNKPEILSTFTYLEEAVKNNPNLLPIQ